MSFWDGVDDTNAGGSIFGMNKNTLVLSALAQAAAQSAMPSRLPVPTGAVIGNIAGGLTNAANTTAALDEKRAQTDVYKAKIPHLQAQAAAIKMSMGGMADILARIQAAQAAGGAATPQVGSVGVCGVPDAASGGAAPGGAAPGGAAPAAGGGASGPAAFVRKYESEGLANQLGISPYNIGYGGTDLSNAPRDENGFPQWEGKDGPSGKSHAAGAYQFQKGTWAQYAKPLGITDFSPESQDKVFAAAHADQGFKPWTVGNPKLAAALLGGAAAGFGRSATPPQQAQPAAPQRPVQLASAGPIGPGMGGGSAPPAAAPAPLAPPPRLVTNQTLAGPAAYDASQISHSPTAPVAGDARADLERKERLRQQDPFLGQGLSGVGAETRAAAAPGPLAPPVAPQAGPPPMPAAGPVPAALAPPMPAPRPVAAAPPQMPPPAPLAPPPRMPAPGAPPGAGTMRSGGAVDPLQLAVTGALGQMGGMTEFTKPIENYYYQSPEYKVGLERALNVPRLEQREGEKGIDLRYAGPNAAATAAAEYPYKAGLETHTSDLAHRNAWASQGLRLDANGNAVAIPGFRQNTAATEGEKAAAVAAAQQPTTQQNKRYETGLDIGKTQAAPYSLGPGEQRYVPPVSLPEPMGAPGQGQGPAPGPQAALAPPPGVAPGPQPLAPVAQGLDPAEVSRRQERAKTDEADRKLTITEAAGAQDERASLLNMQGSVGSFRQGPLASWTQQAGRYLQMVDPSWTGQVANYEDFVKNGEALVRKAVRATDSNPAAVQFPMIRNSLPNPEMSDTGLRRVMNELIGASDYKIAKARALAGFEQQSGGTSAGFTEHWLKNASPYAFMVSRMHPEDRQELFAKLNASEQGRAELKTLGEQLGFITQAGLAQ